VTDGVAVRGSEGRSRTAFESPADHRIDAGTESLREQLQRLTVVYAEARSQRRQVFKAKSAEGDGSAQLQPGQERGLPARHGSLHITGDLALVNRVRSWRWHPSIPSAPLKRDLRAGDGIKVMVQRSSAVAALSAQALSMRMY
jgi:hypothetical protein